MKIFAVVINRDDTIRVASADVVKETPQFYIIGPRFSWDDPRYAERDAFGWSSRVAKYGAFTSARAALASYMERRQRDKQNALSVAGQATKQIASANELLMQLPPGEPEADPAVARTEGIATGGPRAPDRSSRIHTAVQYGGVQPNKGDEDA